MKRTQESFEQAHQAAKGPHAKAAVVADFTAAVHAGEVEGSEPAELPAELANSTDSNAFDAAYKAAKTPAERNKITDAWAAGVKAGRITI